MENFLLNNDSPIYKTAHDAFGYSKVADHWAKIIYGTSINAENFTFSIEGPWGSGKTSMAQLIKNKLKEINQDSLQKKVHQKENGEKYIYCNNEINFSFESFSPWFFSDLQSLMLEFIKILKTRTGIEKSENAYSALKNLAFMTIPILSITNDPATNAISKVFTNALDKNLESESLERSYQKVVNYYKQSNIRKIIFIDDIDRLDENETELIFKLVKTAGLIPGITFVLCFDRDKLKIKDIQTSNVHFLDKIIQHRLYMPPVQHHKLKRYLFESIISIIKPYFPYISNHIQEFELDLLYKSEIPWENKITTIRDIKRLINSFQVAVQAAPIQDINLADLFVLTTLRHFYTNSIDEKVLEKISKSEVMTNNDEKDDFLLVTIDFLSNPDRESKNRIFSQYRGGLYFSEEMKIQEILKHLASSTDPSTSPLEQHVDLSALSQDSEEILEIINTYYKDPQKISVPGLFSHRILEYITNSSQIDFINQLEYLWLGKWYRDCVLYSLKNSDKSIDTINENFIFNVKMSYLYNEIRPLKEEADGITDAINKYLHNITSGAEYYLLQVINNDHKILDGNDKICVNLFAGLGNFEYQKSVFENLPPNLQANLIALYIWAGYRYFDTNSNQSIIEEILPVLSTEVTVQSYTGSQLNNSSRYYMSLSSLRTTLNISFKV